MKLFLLVLSMVLIIEGLPYFIFPEKMQNFLKILSEVEPNSLRKYGFFMILTGLFLLYLFK
jgi:uncharacterized protein YjeT (DUF2065 family)